MSKSSRIRDYYRQASHRLRVTRLALGISEREAADAYGVSLSTYRKYEAGGSQRGMKILGFSRKYAVSLNWLVGGDASEIGPHLSDRAPGKVAILPLLLTRHQRRRVGCVALHPLSA